MRGRPTWPQRVQYLGAIFILLVSFDSNSYLPRLFWLGIESSLAGRSAYVDHLRVNPSEERGQSSRTRDVELMES